MTEQSTTQTSGNGFLRVVGGFFKVLLRLVATIVIGALVGLGLYYGIPWVYRNVVGPVQQNSTSIAVLEQQVDQEYGRLKEENIELQERVANLEAALTGLREESGVSSQDLGKVQTQVDMLDERLLAVEGKLTERGEMLEALQEDFEEANATLTAHYESVQGETTALHSQIILVQVAHDLLKVRLMLLEENPRAAQDALALALDHVERARTLAPDLEAPLADLQERMSALDTLIAERSFRVTPELEALWADVMDLALPLSTSAGNAVEVSEEGAVTPARTPFPTPTPYRTITPTPFPTPTPPPTSTPAG